jgi:hypothetical protein
VIVLHRETRLPNYQAWVLGRHSQNAVQFAKPSEPLRPHTVYLASPGRHLIIQPNRTFALVDGFNFGYNAANDTYGDLLEMGVIDPTTDRFPHPAGRSRNRRIELSCDA